MENTIKLSQNELSRLTFFFKNDGLDGVLLWEIVDHAAIVIAEKMQNESIDFKTAFSQYSNSAAVVRLITTFKNTKTATFKNSVTFFWNQFWNGKSLFFAWLVWAFFTTLSYWKDLQHFTFFAGFAFVSGFVFYKFQDKKGRFLMREMNRFYVLLLAFLIGIDYLITKVEVINEIIALVWMVYLLVIRNYFLTFNHLKTQMYATKIN